MVRQRQVGLPVELTIRQLSLKIMTYHDAVRQSIAELSLANHLLCIVRDHTPIPCTSVLAELLREAHVGELSAE